MPWQYIVSSVDNTYYKINLSTGMARSNQKGWDFTQAAVTVWLYSEWEYAPNKRFQLLCYTWSGKNWSPPLYISIHISLFEKYT